MGKQKSSELEAIATAKRKFDQQLVALDAEYRIKKAALKQPVLSALKDALDANESVTGIAIYGMGYTAPGLTALKAFVGARGTSRASLLEEIVGADSAFSGEMNLTAASVASVGAPDVYKWKHYETPGGIGTWTTYTLSGEKFEVSGIPSVPVTTDADYIDDKVEAAAILRAFTAHTHGKYTYKDEDQAILDSAN